MNNTREKRTQMNMQERVYDLLQQTMNQPEHLTCQCRQKLNEQVHAKAVEKSFCSQVKPTTKNIDHIEFCL